MGRARDAKCPGCKSTNDGVWDGTIYEASIEVLIVDGKPLASSNSWAGDVIVECGDCGWSGDYGRLK